MADENIENQINTFGTAQAADGTEAKSLLPEAALGTAATAGAYKFRKPIIKAAGKTLSALTGPLPIAGAYAIPGFGMNPKTSIDSNNPFSSAHLVMFWTEESSPSEILVKS